jgi:hypothetical protein
MNNRELYSLVTTELGKDLPEDKKPRLDNFLISLWVIAARSEKGHPVIDDLVAWLRAAFEHSPPNFDPQWLRRMGGFAESAYEEWENTILTQITQLHELFKDGVTDELDEIAEAEDWYNLNVGSYLASAASGLYGGDENDDTEPYEFEQFSWQDFTDFLEIGKTGK